MSSNKFVVPVGRLYLRHCAGVHAELTYRIDEEDPNYVGVVAIQQLDRKGPGQHDTHPSVRQVVECSDWENPYRTLRGHTTSYEIATLENVTEMLRWWDHEHYPIRDWLVALDRRLNPYMKALCVEAVLLSL